MRTFVFGEISNFLTDEKHVAYCYSGKNRRGSVALLSNGSMLVIAPNGYMPSYDDEIEDYSHFELWSLIHEMEEDDMRQEAVNRFFDVYNNLYNAVTIFEQYPFIME